MTPAEELHHAAATVRAAAAEATPGPWTDEQHHGVTCAPGDYIAVGPYVDVMHPGDTRWIALMSPSTAEPLAAWLESEADAFAGFQHGHGPPLALAREINRNAEHSD